MFWDPSWNWPAWSHLSDISVIYFRAARVAHLHTIHQLPPTLSVSRLSFGKEDRLIQTPSFTKPHTPHTHGHKSELKLNKSASGKKSITKANLQTEQLKVPPLHPLNTSFVGCWQWTGPCGFPVMPQCSIHAFSTTDHSILLQRLELTAGCPGKALRWFEWFLSHRFHVVD